MCLHFGLDALRRYIGVGQGPLRIVAHPRAGNHVAGDAPHDGGDNLPGVAAVAALLEHQRSRLPRFQRVTEPIGDDHGEQDGRAVQGGVGIGLGALLHLHLGQRVQPRNQLAGVDSAVQVHHAGRSEDLAIAAQRPIHQRKEQNGQRNAESQLGPVVEKQLQLKEGNVERAEHGRLGARPG